MGRINNNQSLEEKLESDFDWDNYAKLYNEVIVHMPHYQELNKEIVDATRECATVCDLGCGTGYHLKTILKINKPKLAVGVDKSREMINFAFNDLKNIKSPSKFGLYYTDAVDFTYPCKFDAVISSNVLFALPKPMEYLDNAFRLLKDGGRLIISSPYEYMDIDILEKEIKDYYKNAELYDEKKEHIERLIAANRLFTSKELNIYSVKRIKDILLNFIGFDEIVTDKKMYLHNFFIVAVKYAHGNITDFMITNKENMLNKGFRLRYHWLYDRYKIIKPNDECLHREEYDRNSIGGFAINKKNGKVMGFINYIPPNENLPYTHPSIDEIRRKFKKVGAFNGYYTCATEQNKGWGKTLLALMLRWIICQGIEAVVVEVNPDVIRIPKSLGGEIMGDEYIAHNGQKSVPFLFNLRKQRTKKAVNKVIDKYQKIHGYIIIKEQIV